MSCDFQLSVDAWNRLVYTDALGEQHVGVEALHAFPFSDPERWIALVDEASQELELIEDLNALPENERELIRRELARREFVPAIQRITRIDRLASSSEWDVETDRGPTRLTVKSEEDVRRLPGRKALVIDAQGIRHLIADTRQLDGTSRRLLEHYL
ncbi:MAG: DUF1854 domain-containing protein [Pirellulales bacterium]|nr:DUF1854 domain-containing protein [Pirellulales bacterium]